MRLIWANFNLDRDKSVCVRFSFCFNRSCKLKPFNRQQQQQKRKYLNVEPSLLNAVCVCLAITRIRFACKCCFFIVSWLNCFFFVFEFVLFYYRTLIGGRKNKITSLTETKKCLDLCVFACVVVFVLFFFKS